MGSCMASDLSSVQELFEELNEQLCLTTGQELVQPSLSGWTVQDVQQYFDNLDPLKVVRYLFEHGFDQNKLKALLHLHCLPSLEVAVSKSHHFTVPIKSTGFWTGTRTAVRASRLPLIDAVSTVIHADPSFLLDAFK